MDTLPSLVWGTALHWHGLQHKGFWTDGSGQLWAGCSPAIDVVLLRVLADSCGVMFVCQGWVKWPRGQDPLN
jgi:hypothetical protein